MCLMKDFFETLELKETGVVLLRNNKACKVQGMSTVHLRMFDNYDILLQDVWYVPELKRILLLISMFDSLGYTTKVEHGMMKISNGALIVAKGTKRNGLFILDGYTVIAHAFVTSQTLYYKIKL
uniref:Retrovirus-related Pol polyprotein from transposon TNT 1-94-like beta-barrel domain-containing protein n=1 Tax=Cajanus cajan TaxID=3821 RepID=A0A151RVG9_CAJCA|nr:hypothetical protein KK1_031912 [Cajanus cajan]